MAAQTENPVFAGDTPPEDDDGADPIKVDDLEAASATLREQMEPQTVEAMEAVMRAREAQLQAKFDAKIDQLEAKLAEGGAPFSSAVRSAVAHLSETRPNWHQATVMMLSSRRATHCGAGAARGGRLQTAC